MSKLFELLQAAAKTHKRTSLAGFCALRVNEFGKATVAVAGEVVAAGNDESETIAKLSARFAGGGEKSKTAEVKEFIREHLEILANNHLCEVMLMFGCGESEKLLDEFLQEIMGNPPPQTEYVEQPPPTVFF